MKINLSLLSAALLLGSCGLYNNYERNNDKLQTIAQNLFRQPLGSEALFTDSDTASFGTLSWRTVFTDPQLQSLIQRALERNADVQKAELVIKQAEIGLELNQLAYLPQVALAPSGNLSKAFIEGTDWVKTYNLPVQASWQVDAFGRLRNVEKQGQQSLLQARAGEQAARTAIVTTMANLYFSLQMLDEQLSTTQRTLALWQKSIAAMETMKKAGMTTSAALASSKAQVLQIKATLPTLEESRRKAEHALCLLMHEAPHSIARNRFTATSFPKQFSLGMPMTLLANRPDLVIAEAEMASAFYGERAARGAFFPQLTISASGAFTNSLGAMVLNPGKFLAAGVASITQPLFAQGKIKGAHQISRLKQETAQLNFEKALLTAGKEVSDAMASYHKATLRSGIIYEQIEELKKANADIEFLFRNGNTTSYIETLTAQMNLLNAELALINTRYETAQAVVALYQALGGGKQ